MTFIIIAAIISLTSCSKEKEIISKSEEFLKKDLLDPKSYELIESKLDTTYKSEFYEVSSQCDSNIGDIYLERCNNETEYAKIWVGSTTEYGMAHFKELYSKAKEYRDSAFFYMDRSDSLKRKALAIKGTNQDSIFLFTVKFKYYSVNKDGQRGIRTSLVRVHKTGEPIEIFNIE